MYLLNDWTADFRKLLRLYNFVPLPGDSAEYVYRDRDKIMMIAISFKRLIENARRRNRIFLRTWDRKLELPFLSRAQPSVSGV